MRSLIVIKVILDSSMVEHTAVNRGVVGSSPTRGVFFFSKLQFSMHSLILCRCGSIGRAADL